jgi:putative PIN family toxin of toxin-antitoxin system
MGAAQRVVLDTNVLVAAAYNAGSASRRVVEACLDGGLAAVLSPSLRREYEHILARAARGRPYLDRLQCLLEGAEVVVPEETPRAVPDDPDDDKLVAVALAAGAVLVTNDAHLLAIAGTNGLRVVRPVELAGEPGAI